MRVTHLIKATGIAGAEAHLLTLLPELAQHGIEPRLIILESPSRPVAEFARRAEALGVRAELMPIYADVDPSLVVRLGRVLRANSPDVLHTHLIHADLHGALAAGLAGVRSLVRTCHNDDRFRRWAPVRAVSRALGRRFGRVIVISDYLGEFVKRVEGVPPARVARIYYGLDPDEYLRDAQADGVRLSFGIGSDDGIIAYVGRLTGQKGVGDLLEAFGYVAQQFPAARLLIVGDGPLRRRLAAQAGRAGRGRVIFVGWRTDVPAIMQAIDVLVVPSHWEGFGLVTLEAMAARRPMIASRVSALPEIVRDGETGWLVPPGDARALAAALGEALRDPARARAMGRQGRVRLETHFTISRMVADHARVYNDALCASDD